MSSQEIRLSLCRAEMAMLRLVQYRGVPMNKALPALLDTWGDPKILVKADRDEAGGHPIEDIARRERAFYHSLSENARKALRDIMARVRAYYSRYRARPHDAQLYDLVDGPVDNWRAAAAEDVANNQARTYLTGQVLGSDALKRPLRPLSDEDKKTVGFLQNYTLNEIDDSFNDLKADLRRILLEGIARGENPQQVAHRLGVALGDYDTNWHLVAITETARAEAAGRLQEFKDAGLLHVVGSSAHDSKVCDECLRLIDNQIVSIDEAIHNSNYKKPRAQWEPCIPLHPACRCVWLPVPDELSPSGTP